MSDVFFHLRRFRPRPRRAAVLNAVAAGLGAALFGAPPAPALAQAATWTAQVVAGGLAGPRGLAFGPDGGLYVAESGAPGDGSGPFVTVRGVPQYVAPNGAVARWDGTSLVRTLTGLPTVYGLGNPETGGINDIAFGADGAPFIALGGGFDPSQRATYGAAGSRLHQVLTLGRSFDVGAHEVAFNPGGGPLDSNAWAVAPLAGGDALVADAGGNALLRLSAASGAVSTVATFAPRPMFPGAPFPSDPVPTGLAVSGDSWFMGELTGFPFAPGAAQIWRGALAGGAPTVFAAGFTHITDLAVGGDGAVYVLEYDSNGLLNPGNQGALWKLSADGSSRTKLYDGLLDHATGLALAGDGSFWVSNRGDTGDGQLLHITAVPEPGSWALMAAGLAALAGALRRARR